MDITEFTNYELTAELRRRANRGSTDEELIRWKLTFPCGAHTTKVHTAANSSLVTKMAGHWDEQGPWPTKVASEGYTHESDLPKNDGVAADCFNCPIKKDRLSGQASH